MKKDFNPEILYSYLKEKKWKDFLYTLNKEKKGIFSNSVALNATNYFLDEFLKSVDQNAPELYLEEFDILILLHNGKYFSLKEEEYRLILSLKIEGLSKVDYKRAYRFAKNYTQYEFASKYCKDYEAKLPLRILHSNEDKMDVTVNRNISKIDLTIPLFKSEREISFFNAIKEYFPNYHTYPNVAISSILDYQKIESKLSTKQREYFLKSIIDCVVFDPMDKYKPKYFFEIDSKYHDNEKIKQKDNWKDLFFSKAGKRLYRIRPINNKIDKEMFLDVIKDIFHK